MDKEQRKQFYQQQAQQLTADIKRLRKRNTTFVVSELVSFALMIAAIAVSVSTETGFLYVYLAALMLVAYILIRYADVKNSNKIESLENTCSVYRKEMAYLEGDFSQFDDGSQFIDPHHRYSYDMDIFGHNALYNRINRTITTGGSETLASMLNGDTPQDSPIPHPAAIAETSRALKELAEQEPLRTQFLANGQRTTINTADVLAALQAMKEVKLPGWPKTVLSLIIAYMAIIGLILSIIASSMGFVKADVPITWLITQFFICYGLNFKALKEVHKVVNKMYRQLKTYIRLMVLIIESDLKTSVCKEIKAQLTADNTNALTSFEELQHILDSLDRRGNQLGLFLSNAFACSDFFLLRRFIKWRAHYLMQVEDWINAVSRFDALVSMATFRYNEPSSIDAEIIESQEIVYEAENLRHPFLGEKAVDNDFSVKDGQYYIITGANMAGKSTFLRTIGVNYILAMCGMPVFAKRLKVSVFELFSSMRTTDDLTQGISYFNAELLRLQQLISYCQQQQRTLIILDEILKGTNSLDKLNGSRLFLESIQKLPITGIIATHDLELSKMADTYPNRIHNYCFEIELSDHVKYTYKITEGVARNQNATFLLNRIISQINQ